MGFKKEIDSYNPLYAPKQLCLKGWFQGSSSSFMIKCKQTFGIDVLFSIVAIFITRFKMMYCDTVII